jgi:hypothetical protein
MFARFESLSRAVISLVASVLLASVVVSAAAPIVPIA